MRAIPFLAVLLLSATTARAADVDITCTVSHGDTFIGPNMFPAEIDGPWNFTITSEGLETPWGGYCGLMKGEVTPESISVSCSGDLGGSTSMFKKTVTIDRHLGTYREALEITDATTGDAKTFKTGTCQKRASF